MNDEMGADPGRAPAFTGTPAYFSLARMAMLPTVKLPTARRQVWSKEFCCVGLEKFLAVTGGIRFRALNMRSTRPKSASVAIPGWTTGNKPDLPSACLGEGGGDSPKALGKL